MIEIFTDIHDHLYRLYIYKCIGVFFFFELMFVKSVGGLYFYVDYCLT